MNRYKNECGPKIEVVGQNTHFFVFNVFDEDFVQAFQPIMMKMVLWANINQWRRHGGGEAGQLAPPQPPIGHPVRSMQIRGDFRVRKNGGGG